MQIKIVHKLLRILRQWELNIKTKLELLWGPMPLYKHAAGFVTEFHLGSTFLINTAWKSNIIQQDGWCITHSKILPSFLEFTRPLRRQDIPVKKLSSTMRQNPINGQLSGRDGCCYGFKMQDLREILNEDEGLGKFKAEVRVKYDRCHIWCTLPSHFIVKREH